MFPCSLAPFCRGWGCVCFWGSVLFCPGWPQPPPPHQSSGPPLPVLPPSQGCDLLLYHVYFLVEDPVTTTSDRVPLFLPVLQFNHEGHRTAFRSQFPLRSSDLVTTLDSVSHLSHWAILAALFSFDGSSYTLQHQLALNLICKDLTTNFSMYTWFLLAWPPECWD